MNWLLEPLTYTFVQRGLLTALLVGIMCATLGVYVVLRRMAFLGDALSHSIFPGLVLAYLQQWNLFWGALGAGLLTALGIGLLTRRQTLHEDTAIGVLYTGMLALGIVLMSTTRSFRDLTHLLFGNLIGVRTAELIMIAVLAALVLGVLLLFHKELQLTSVDPTYATTIGLNPDVIRYGLLMLLALVVVAAIQAVGVILTSALLITPAATAALLTARLQRMLLLSVLFAVGASITGLYASFYLQVASGAAIVLACTLCFVTVWLSRTLRHGRRLPSTAAELADP